MEYELEKAGRPVRLVCKEGMRTPMEVLDFITDHLMGNPAVASFEAVCAYEATGEIMARCFRTAR